MNSSTLVWFVYDNIKDNFKKIWKIISKLIINGKVCMIYQLNRNVKKDKAEDLNIKSWKLLNFNRLVDEEFCTLDFRQSGRNLVPYLNGFCLSNSNISN